MQTATTNVLFQLEGVGVVEADLQTGRFRRANRAFCEMLGRSEAELAGLTFQDVTHPDDLERGAAGFAAFVTGQTRGVTSLSRVFHGDGSVRWLELHFTLLREGDGAVGVAVVGDVTERIRESERLRRSEEHARIAVQVAEMGTWNWDVESGEVRWNAKHFELFGMAARPGPLSPAAFERHVHPGDRDWVMGRLQRAVDDRRTFQAEFRAVTDGGEVRWMSGYGQATATSPGGETLQMSGVMFDISERKEAEAALRDLNETLEQRVAERTEALARSERRFSQAFNVGPVAACITTLDRSGVDDETFLEINDEFCKLTGYEKGEVLGRSARDLGMWSSPEDQRRLEHAGAQAGEFHDLELHLQTKTGEVRNILLSGTVISLDGQQGLLKMFYDITDRKRTEAQLVGAIQGVMSDTAWFSQSVLERFARIKGDSAVKETVELSPRERQVLERVAQGKNNNAIAEELALKPQTVRNYVATVYDKLGVHTRAEAVVWARERGLAGF